MFRKLLALIALALVVWLGARYFAHRGEIRATFVFHDAGDIRKGDAVVEDGATIGRVTKVTRLDGQDSVDVRIDRGHRRDVVNDSLIRIDDHRVLVNNTFAIGRPIDDGAVLRVKDDRVRQWLAKHADSVKPFVDKVKRAADAKIDAIDAELASATAKVPEWKRQGREAFEQHIDELKKKFEATEKDLQKSDKVAEARKLREKFERWLQEVER